MFDTQPITLTTAWQKIDLLGASNLTIVNNDNVTIFVAFVQVDVAPGASEGGIPLKQDEDLHYTDDGRFVYARAVTDTARIVIS